MRILIIISLTTIISSCSNKAELGNSYYYLDSFEAIDVGYPEGAIIYKGDAEYHFDTTIISREVVQATRTDKYIFAKQIATKNKLDTNFYIIDKTNDKVFGPLKSDTFKKLKSSIVTEE